MNKYTAIFLILIVIGLIWLYFSKESGHTQAMQKLIEKHRDAMDSSAWEAERWRRIAKEYGDQQRKDATRAMKAENSLNYLREENEILSRRIIRYNNLGLDSLLSARYGR